MKLRIRDNSIRFRLTRSEVKELLKHKQVQSTTQLTQNSALTYAVRLSTAVQELTVTFADNQLSVLIPTELANNWASSDQVGLEQMRPTGTDSTLRILVEKDFACLKPRKLEDDSDAFNNPNAGSLTC